MQHSNTSATASYAYFVGNYGVSGSEVLSESGDDRDGLYDRGHDEGAVDEMLEPFDDPLAAIREYDCTPPALSTSGGRRLFRRLSVAADVDTSDDSKDYLTLHGGRRGAGEMYYITETTAAQPDEDRQAAWGTGETTWRYMRRMRRATRRTRPRRELRTSLVGVTLP